jgi:hypothetical protein
MGRHNDVRKALDGARIPDKHDKAMRLLLDKADFQAAEIPENRYSMRTSTLAARLDVSDDTGRRILAALAEHGWFIPYETKDRGKIAGLLSAGRSYGFHTSGVCPMDGRPLRSPRAKYCSARCRQMASRMKRDKGQVSRGDVTLHAVETESEPLNRTKCDDVTFHASHVTHPSVTNPRSAPCAAEEHVEEEVREELALADLGPASRFWHDAMMRLYEEE